jgi:hypothetical protein
MFDFLIPLLDVVAPEQALTWVRFQEALHFHGFAVQITPFGLSFWDLRRREQVPVAPERAKSATGGSQIDHLATLKALLAWRCERVRATF